MEALSVCKKVALTLFGSVVRNLAEANSFHAGDKLLPFH